MALAFLTAAGFGRDSIGGRGGTITKVTNLNNSGAGSFRAAVEGSGLPPRIVVFTVSGTIQIATQITITSPYLTIAGQTSPGGVQIRGTPGTPTGITFGSGCHDVIVRHLRIRIGGQESGDDGESFMAFSSSAAPNHCYNMIFDHCTIEWGHDSMCMCYGNWDLITWQYCLIAEGIRGVGGVGGRKAIHLGGNTLDMSNHGRISVHHNVMAHCEARTPNMTRARLFEFTSNVVYNNGSNNGALYGQDAFGWSAKGNVKSNYVKSGPNTGPGRNVWVSNYQAGKELGGTKLYTDGNNWGTQQPTGGADDWVEFRDADSGSGDIQAPESQCRVGTPFAVVHVPVDPPGTLLALLLPHIGASKPSRDAVDTRIVDEVTNGTGALPSNSYAGGTWPTLTGGSAPTDTNNDGIADAWAIAHGYNPSGSGYATTVLASGQTVLENYLNILAGDADEQEENQAGGEAPVIVQVSAPAGTAAGATLTATLNGVTAGNAIIYVIAVRNAAVGAAIVPPTGYTEDIESTSTNNGRVGMGSRFNVTAGTHAPVFTLPDATTQARAYLLEVSGITLKENANFVFNNSSTSVVSGAVTPLSSHSMLIAAAGLMQANASTATTITPTGAWAAAQRAEDETSTPGCPLSVLALTDVTGSQQATWTLGAARNNVGVIVSYEVAVAPTGGSGQRLAVQRRRTFGCMANMG